MPACPGAPEPASPPRADAREFEFSARDFDRVRRLIYAHAGIALNESKSNMVYGRLARRLRERGLRRFEDYLRLLEADDRGEREAFVNSLTTNFTAFFREPHHFDLLAGVLREAARAGEPRVWSAACSTGEEPYSVAITAAETFGTSRPPVRILATDIDTAVLETARRGVYRDASVARLDAGVVRRHFRRGAGGSAGAIEVSEGLRERIDFRRLNLLDAAWPVQERFDAIFCRNVLIYFDRAGQRAILERLAPRLAPGGVLCVGHAENLHWARDLFAPCGRTAYRAARPASSPRGERPWLR